MFINEKGSKFVSALQQIFHADIVVTIPNAFGESCHNMNPCSCKVNGLKLPWHHLDNARGQHLRRRRGGQDSFSFARRVATNTIEVVVRKQTIGVSTQHLQAHGQTARDKKIRVHIGDFHIYGLCVRRQGRNWYLFHKWPLKRRLDSPWLECNFGISGSSSLSLVS